MFTIRSEVDSRSVAYDVANKAIVRTSKNGGALTGYPPYRWLRELLEDNKVDTLNFEEALEEYNRDAAPYNRFEFKYLKKAMRSKLIAFDKLLSDESLKDYSYDEKMWHLRAGYNRASNLLVLLGYMTVAPSAIRVILETPIFSKYRNMLLHQGRYMHSHGAAHTLDLTHDCSTPHKLLRLSRATYNALLQADNLNKDRGNIMALGKITEFFGPDYALEIAKGNDLFALDVAYSVTMFVRLDHGRMTDAKVRFIERLRDRDTAKRLVRALYIVARELDTDPFHLCSILMDDAVLRDTELSTRPRDIERITRDHQQRLRIRIAERDRETAAEREIRRGEHGAELNREVDAERERRRIEHEAWRVNMLKVAKTVEIDGHNFRPLLTEEELDYEGSRMSNCIGRYWLNVDSLIVSISIGGLTVADAEYIQRLDNKWITRQLLSSRNKPATKEVKEASAKYLRMLNKLTKEMTKEEV